MEGGTGMGGRDEIGRELEEGRREGKGGEGERKGRRKEEEGRGRKGREGETRHTNPSLLPAPL